MPTSLTWGAAEVAQRRRRRGAADRRPDQGGDPGRGIGKVLGRSVTVDVEVTALEPGAAFGYRPIQGPLRTNNLYTFESQAGGTLVVLTDDLGLNGIFRVFLPVMPSFVRSAYRKNLAGLKAALEAQPAQRRDEVT